MAAAATQLFDSISFGGLHARVTGLVSGINSLNLTTLIPNTWPTGYIPQGIIIVPIKSGVTTVASKVMYDPATLSATNIDLYCDATGSTSCDIFVY